jgi:arylsulfatase A-like enzyme
MAVRWPAKIKHDATPRPQFHQCNDLVPTIYEVIGITPPLEVNGVPQDPIRAGARGLRDSEEGTSGYRPMIRRSGGGRMLFTASC